MFEKYIKSQDFVGADMVRKYLQAGSTKKVIHKDCRAFFGKAYKSVKTNKQYFTLKKNFINLQKGSKDKVSSDSRRFG